MDKNRGGTAYGKGCGIGYDGAEHDRKRFGSKGETNSQSTPTTKPYYKDAKPKFGSIDGANWLTNRGTLVSAGQQSKTTAMGGPWYVCA